MKHKRKYSPNRKFILNQFANDLDPKVEISVLKCLLKQMEIEENYEVAELVYRRLEDIKSTET
jgi:hypothetical protein